MTLILTKWCTESKKLSDERFAMVTVHMSMEELRDYRDNYKKSEVVFNRIICLLLMIFLTIFTVSLILMDLEIAKKDPFCIGMMAGFLMCSVLFMSNGRYVKKIEKEMERRYFEEKE